MTGAQSLPHSSFTGKILSLRVNLLGRDGLPAVPNRLDFMPESRYHGSMNENKNQRLKPLNDFAFQKSMGEPGDEEQLMGFLKAALRKTGKDDVASVTILPGKDLPAEIAGRKAARLDVLAEAMLNMAKSNVNLEAQIRNEYNIKKRSPFYWAKKYIENLDAGHNYDELIPVIAINIIDFGEYPVDDFHLSFHWWEDTHKDLLISDVCEIHYLDMVKFRRFRKRDARFSLDDPLHRWLVYFDEYSSQEQIEEVVKMDNGIAAFQNRMEMIARDPALKRAYDAYDKAESDWVTSMATARSKGRAEGEKNVLDLLSQGMSPADILAKYGQ